MRLMHLWFAFLVGKTKIFASHYSRFISQLKRILKPLTVKVRG